MALNPGRPLVYSSVCLHVDNPINFCAMSSYQLRDQNRRNPALDISTLVNVTANGFGRLLAFPLNWKEIFIVLMSFVIEGFWE